MRLARLILGALGLALAAACAGAALAAQGGRVSPALDVLTNLAPLYLVGGVLGGALSAAGRGTIRKAGLAMAVLAALGAAALMAPEFLRSTGPTAPLNAAGQIKLVELNVWRENPDLDRLADWLASEDPDIIVLDESSTALRDLIVRRLGRGGVAGYASTVMIFARGPYLQMDRPVIGPQSHLTFVNATYPSQSGPFEMVAAHTDWPTSGRQGAQSATLAGVVARLPRRRMILAGDFNSAPWSFRRRRDDAAFGLIRRDRALATWPAGHAGPWRGWAPVPFLPLDHVYAGPGWATVSVRRGPRVGSDHYPLVVTLAPVAPR
jgi:endonuclease/exonuclease/phosphatase (EEP) superfamily protein YafD